MFRELAHFARHAPATLRLKRRLDQGALYDHLCARQDGLGLATWRAALCGDLRGRVVEIGAGTGLMFAHYPADAAVTVGAIGAGAASLSGVPGSGMNAWLWMRAPAATSRSASAIVAR